MRLLYNIIFFLFLATNGYAQGLQNEGQDDPDLMLDIGGGPSTIGAAFYSAVNMHFKRVVVTPNYIGSSSSVFQIFAGRKKKFRSFGVLAGYAFPADPENVMFVASTGFSHNTLIQYGSTGLFGSEKIGSESSFGWPVHAKFYVPTKSGIGLYAGARLDINGIDEYMAFTIGIRLGRVGHWDW